MMLIIFAGIPTKNHRVTWEANLGPTELPFDGIPFYVVGFQVLECQHGKDCNLYQKRKHASKNEVRK